jgi:hypothetical protein
MGVTAPAQRKLGTRGRRQGLQQGPGDHSAMYREGGSSATRVPCASRGEIRTRGCCTMGESRTKMRIHGEEGAGEKEGELLLGRWRSACCRVGERGWRGG